MNSRPGTSPSLNRPRTPCLIVFSPISHVWVVPGRNERGLRVRPVTLDDGSWRQEASPGDRRRISLLRVLKLYHSVRGSRGGADQTCRGSSRTGVPDVRVRSSNSTISPSHQPLETSSRRIFMQVSWGRALRYGRVVARAS